MSKSVHHIHNRLRDAGTGQYNHSTYQKNSDQDPKLGLLVQLECKTDDLQRQNTAQQMEINSLQGELADTKNELAKTNAKLNEIVSVLKMVLGSAATETQEEEETAERVASSAPPSSMYG